MECSLKLVVRLCTCEEENNEAKKAPELATSNAVCQNSQSPSQLTACEGCFAEASKRKCEVDEDFQLQAKKVRKVLSAAFGRKNCEADEDFQLQDKKIQKVLSRVSNVKSSRGCNVDQSQRKKKKRKVWSCRRRRRKHSKNVKLSSVPDKEPLEGDERPMVRNSVASNIEDIQNSILFLSDDENDTDKGEALTNADLASECPEWGMEELLISTSSTVAGKFAYPSRNDPEAVEVHVSDLQHLQDFVFVNDTVIDFYIKYLQSTEGWCTDLKDQLHFYNSFFYKKLHEAVQSQKKENNNRKMQNLRKWTKGINIFEKSYLFVPIHDNSHWSLAIICLPGASSETISPDSCCILHFDSMDNGHKSQNVYRMLRSYLVAEWEFQNETGGIMKTAGCVNRERLLEKDISAKRVKVPLQENQFDCGLFLLHFIECFVKEATPTLRSTEVKNKFGRDWFIPQDASNKRETIRKTIEDLLASDFNGQTVTETLLKS